MSDDPWIDEVRLLVEELARKMESAGVSSYGDAFYTLARLVDEKRIERAELLRRIGYYEKKGGNDG